MIFNKNNISIFILATFLLLASSDLFAQKKKHKKGKLTEQELVQFKANFIEANSNRLIGNYDKAEALYASCLKFDKKSAATYYDLATIYMAKKDPDKAISYARIATILNNENVWYKLLLVNLYQQKGALANAAEILEDILKSDKSKLDLYYDLAAMYIQMRETKSAIKTLNKIEKISGVTEQISLEKERIYTKNREFDKSIVEVEKLIEKFPNEARYIGILAELYLTQKNYDKANETYQKQLSIDEFNGMANLAVADYYRIIDDKKQMMFHLKKAFKSPDLLIDAKIKMLVSFYSVSSQTEELTSNAYDLLDVLLETYPEEPKVHTVYADYLVKDHRYEEAEKELQLVTKTVKDKYLIWEQLLSLNRELKNYDAQFQNSKEAIEYFPTQPVLYLINALSAIELKRYTDAIASLNTGLPYVYDDKMKASFYVYLGESNHKNNTHEASDEAFDKSIAIDSNNIYVLNNYSYYLSVREENLDKAAKMSKKTIEIDSENSTFLDTYAWILYKQNKFAEAKTYIEKSINFGGNKSAVIIEHYGDILFKLNEKESALVEWRKAFEMDMENKKLENKIKNKQIFE